MGMIRVMQAEHQLWVEHNFPRQKPHQPFLGIVEEVGELAHYHLKNEQEIRGVSIDDAIDALGDIFVYMLSYCNSNRIDLEAAITSTWAKVKQRDWVADPIKGGE